MYGGSRWKTDGSWPRRDSSRRSFRYKRASNRIPSAPENATLLEAAASEAYWTVMAEDAERILNTESIFFFVHGVMILNVNGYVRNDRFCLKWLWWQG